MVENKKTESPFIKAQSKPKRFKALFFGDPGSWKTRTLLQFPSPIVIDMEHGTELYGDEFDFDVKHTTDFDEVVSAVDWLLTNDHKYKTLGIDPSTVLWAADQDKWRNWFMQRKQGGKGFKVDFYEFQVGDWNLIKGDWRKLHRKIMMLDMNFIATAHQKKLYADGEMMKAIGDTFDSEKGMAYIFDIVLQTFVRDGKPMARAIKDRTNRLPKGDFDLSYAVIEKAFGKETLNRKSKPIVLATSDQIDAIRGFYINASKPWSLVEQLRLLKSYKVETEEELTLDNANEILGKFEDAYKKRQEKKDADSKS